MAQNPLGPPPLVKQESAFDRWMRLMYQRIIATGQILWSQISFSGSNLTDIATRNHADLQNLNTASYTHLTSTQATDLTDSGDSTLHYHASDRALANATGTLALANGGTGQALTDPNADRLLFWDDSAGAVAWLTAGSGLTITDTTIAASGSSFPSGTVMLFVQTSAPTGWTKSTTHNDKALRVVSGTVSSGGTSAFSTVFGKTATDSHTLTSGEMPSHSHGDGLDPAGDQVAYFSAGATPYYSGYKGTTGNTGGGGGHTHNMDIRVQYVDVIIATKD